MRVNGVNLFASLTLMVVVGFAHVSLAQGPIIFSNGVVNGASFRPPDFPGGNLVPGSIVSLFGQNLGPGEPALSPGPNLPSQLGPLQTRVRLNDAVDCPLFYASSGQVNCQLPPDLAGSQVRLRVITSSGQSNEMTVPLGPFGLGLFTRNSNGRGPLLASNDTGDPDPGRRFQLNGPDFTARPGQTLTLWGTGLGPTNPQVPGGQGATGQAPAVNQPSVFIGDRPAQVQYAGRAIGFAGLDQINVVIPPDAPPGCAVPLRIQLGNQVGSNSGPPATVPDSLLNWIQKQLGAESQSLSSEEVLALPSHAQKNRTLLWAPRPLTVDDILNNHKERTLAIVNSVGRSQELYREVIKNNPRLRVAPKVMLLHSRFYPEDRKRVELQLSQFFGPEASYSNVILISTQAVEAGIDISADVLLSELAPLSSLIQRAGRVARYPHRNEGQIIVFDLPLGGNGGLRFGAYTSQRDLVTATRCLLAHHTEPVSFGYLTEIEWLNKIHGESDLSAIRHLDSLNSYIIDVERAMDGLNEAACAKLVREISAPL